MRSISFVSVLRAILVALVVVGCVTMAANAQTVYNNGTGTNNGYFYSLYSSGGSATMTFSSSYAGNYAISWSGVNDVVGGKGWSTGSAQTIGYNVGSVSGENNLSIYGWLTNPLAEYYICEFGSVANGTYKGSVSSDGHSYSTYFEQYLDNWGGSGTGSNHTVTTANHFNHWRSLGMTVGNFNYQILGTEAWGGRSGYVNATVW
jgi:endo-1,4-beta-xylanase